MSSNLAFQTTPKFRNKSHRGVDTRLLDSLWILGFPLRALNPEEAAAEPSKFRVEQLVARLHRELRIFWARPFGEQKRLNASTSSLRGVLLVLTAHGAVWDLS